MAEGKGLVCVTGAGGFVASWLVKSLLERGYNVRGTVRDPDNEKKTSHLKALPGAKERLELVRADLLVDGSFDAAVSGCDGVFHTATPVVAIKEDPKAEMIDPAVNGTLNVLKSCAKTTSVKRIVMTSSSSAARFRTDYATNPLLDETSWSDLEFCTKFKMWYAVAKTTAEKAAWDFSEKNNLNLITILPTFIIGPVLPSELSSTSTDVLDLLTGHEKKFQLYGRMGYIHIDDVATVHILAYETPGASGRYICSEGERDNTEVGELLKVRYPNLNVATRFEKGGMPYYNFDVKKVKELGLTSFKSFDVMFDDAIESYRNLNLLPTP
uniref:Cinnamyl alcohol dehydrogenase 1 n=1 Tax=Haplomitrium mnioides TaxID=56921 RepID=A0AAU6NE72_9MARC